MIMKKLYATPDIDVRRYELTELISGSAGNDDGEIDLDAELNPAP